MYTGKLNCDEVFLQFIFTFFLTIVWQYMPKKWFRACRYIWTWCWFEHYIMHGASLIKS